MPNIESATLTSLNATCETTPQRETYADQLIREQLQRVVEQKHVLVFSGFSGSGYKNETGVTDLMASIIKSHAQEYGAHNAVVVAGATEAGIGAVYKIARDLQVETLGIVSKLSPPSDSSEHCQTSVFVDDPEGNWKVLSSEGKSYIVSVAQMGLSGKMIFIGGGEVAASELEEALELKIPTQVHSHYEPKTSNGRPDLRQWCDKNSASLGQEGVVHQRYQG